MKQALILGCLIFVALAAADKLGLMSSSLNSPDRLSRLSPSQVDAVLKTLPPVAGQDSAGQRGPAPIAHPVVAVRKPPRPNARPLEVARAIPAPVARPAVAVEKSPVPDARAVASVRKPPRPNARPLEVAQAIPAPVARPAAAVEKSPVPVARAVASVRKPPRPNARPLEVAQAIPAPVARPAAAVEKSPVPVARPAAAVRKAPSPVERPIVVVQAISAPVAPPVVASARASRRAARALAAVRKTAPPVSRPADNGGALVAGLGTSGLGSAAARAQVSPEPEFRDKLSYAIPTPVAPVVQMNPPPIERPTATEVPVVAGLAAAPPPPAPTRGLRMPAYPQRVSYADGQLSIDAQDSTLAELLAQVSAAVGVKIEIPEGASSERLMRAKFGPGPARETLASLLSNGSFDFMIVAPADNPEGIENVVLIPREKTASGGSGGALAPRLHVNTPSVSGETLPQPHSPVSIQPDNSPAGPAPSAPPNPREPSPLSPAALINRSGLTTEGAMPPPSSMDPQSINQQLQQMYQQRLQMGQQARAPYSPSAPASPGNP